MEAAARSAHRAAGPRQTRRGGRKTSERGWDASRLSYEIGVVLEGVVRRVETIDAGYHGQQALDSLYWASPFLLESVPALLGWVLGRVWEEGGRILPGLRAPGRALPRGQQRGQAAS